MSDNGASSLKYPGTGASTSFRYNEVAGMCQLMDILARGGDARGMMRNDAVRSAYGKFKRMKARLDKQRAKMK